MSKVGMSVHIVAMIATAAKKAGLKSVTVHAIDEKEKLHIYTWSSGQKSLKEVKNGK